MEVPVPQFINEGDKVKVEVATGDDLERVRREGKKIRAGALAPFATGWHAIGAGDFSASFK